MQTSPSTEGVQPPTHPPAETQRQQQNDSNSTVSPTQQKPSVPLESFTPVHPIAQFVANILSPMSLMDQERSYVIGRNVIYGSIVFGLPIGYALNSLSFFYYSILGSALIAFVVTVPNWFQRPDPLRNWVSKEEIDNFYEDLERVRKEEDNKSDERQENEENQSDSAPTAAPASETS